MSVPKSRRRPSRFEVFHNATKLQKELIHYLMTDFGITRDTTMPEAQFLDLKFNRMVDRGVMSMADVKNSFKSWYCNYKKLMSYHTKQNMKSLYCKLFIEADESKFTKN